MKKYLKESHKQLHFAIVVTAVSLATALQHIFFRDYQILNSHKTVVCSKLIMDQVKMSYKKVTQSQYILSKCLKKIGQIKAYL